MAITSQVMNITPEQAEKFLMRNTSNRSINWTRVNAYANDMKSGQWKLNGEAIVFFLKMEVYEMVSIDYGLL